MAALKCRAKIVEQMKELVDGYIKLAALPMSKPLLSLALL